MLRNLSFFVLSLLLFSQCAREKPDIRVMCEAAPMGYYKIKWETFPPMEGIVKIYESTFPDSFNFYSQIAETKISTGFKNFYLVKSTKRSYFNLVFDKKYSIITAERTIPMQALFNFRDLGGYYNADKKQTRWGKLYRSSSLSRATHQDQKILNNLGIKTIIDFRTERERRISPSKYYTSNTFNFPLRGNPPDIFFDRILSKKMRVGDVRVYAQNMFAFLLMNNSDYYSKMFDILLDANNYPVLIHCSWGSERSAVAAALILAALNIDMDQIISDYILSNEQLDYSSLIINNNDFANDEDIQETLTAIFRVHKESITYSFKEITKEYGNFDNYFNTALSLTAEKRKKLKDIMLY